jgi:hypothetical protein
MKEDFHQHSYLALARIAVAADLLEDFLGKNTGTNSDWPIEIKSDCEETAQKLSILLTELKDSLSGYRKQCKVNG